MDAYDRIAAWYVRARRDAVGAADVAALVADLPAGAPVLDLGCGDGRPLSDLLVARGLAVTALDSSGEMVARYRARLPAVPVHPLPVQRAAFPPASFAAVIAWGVLFHLSAADQRAAIAAVGRWLRPGGRFLFTGGAERGATTGTMDGVRFRYVVLGADAYRRHLARAGLHLAQAYTDPWDNDVFVAVQADASTEDRRAGREVGRGH